VGTVLFTALGISCAAIGIHGAFRQPDDLFTDEAEVSCAVLLFALVMIGFASSASGITSC